MKLIMENWNRFLVEEAETQMKASSTVGELRRAVEMAVKAKRKKQGVDALKGYAKNAAVGALMSFIPGGALAKGLYGVASQMYKLPDKKASNTALDKLNVDDETSQIVDDKLENAFLGFLGKYFHGKDDEEEIPDVTELLNQWLDQKFGKEVK